MGGLTALLSLALATHAVSVDEYPLRAGCDAGDRVIATLHAGDPVEIRFALAGSGGGCYKVNVVSDGQTLQGYVSADGISGIEEFEAARRAAPVTNAPATIRAESVGSQQAAVTRGIDDPGAKAARLIEANRPREALSILETAVQTGSDDAGLLSLAGYAAYRSDNMRLAMDYWELSLALRPSAPVQRLYEAAAREQREDLSGERMHSTRFLLRYNRDEMSADTARAITQTLETEYSRITLELSCRPNEQIVVIVQSPEEYQRTTATAEWSTGQYNGRIRVAASDQTQLDAATRKTFAHELVHACMAGLGDFPVWLHEGLAQKLSGETLSVRDRALIERMVSAGQLPRLDKLSQTWTRMSSEHAAVAYATALAAVELFYKHHSGVGPRNLLRNPQMLPQIQADLDRRLRTDALAQLR
jgi:hypothetical protein